MRRAPLAVLAYAALLAAMAGAQLADVPALYDALRTYDVPEAAARALAVLIVVAGGAAAAGLVVGVVRPRLGLGAPAAVLGLLLAAIWFGLAVQALARGLDVPNAGYLGARLPLHLRPWVLVLDAAALGLAAYAWRELRRIDSRVAAKAS